MDGILGKIGSILRISTKSNSTNNRNFRARDITGQVSVDQSSSNLSMKLPEELLDRNRRQEAADGMWKALLEIKNNQVTAVSMMDLFHPGEMSQMRENKFFASALKSLETFRDTEYLSLRSDAENTGPTLVSASGTCFTPIFCCHSNPHSCYRDWRTYHQPTGGGRMK